MFFTRVKILSNKFRSLLFRFLNYLDLLFFSFRVNAFTKLAKNVISLKRIQDIFRLKFKPYLFFLLLFRFLNVPFLFLKIFIEPAESKTKWFLLLFFNLLYFLQCFGWYFFIYNIQGIPCISNASYLFDFLIILFLLLYFSHFPFDCFLFEPMNFSFLLFLWLHEFQMFYRMLQRRQHNLRGRFLITRQCIQHIFLSFLLDLRKLKMLLCNFDISSIYLILLKGTSFYITSPMQLIIDPHLYCLSLSIYLQLWFI